MEKLSSVFGILIGIFMFFVPAYTKMENPTGAWIFFPLFGVSTIAFMAFAFLSDEGTSIANAHRGNKLHTFMICGHILWPFFGKIQFELLHRNFTFILKLKNFILNNFTFGIHLEMIALIFIVVLILLFPLFFPGYYISELLISFLPYLAGISLAFLIFCFVHFKKKMKPGYRYPAHRYFRGISFLVFCFLFFRWSKQFNNYYINEPYNQQVQTGSLKILFANIHKDNDDYSGIEKTISDNDPDMLMFVEFADHHYENLKSFLQARYPYTNTTNRSKKFVGSMVFSKYPLTNKAYDFPQGARRYGYFSLLRQNQQIYFYLVHTSSPDSYAHFIMRNQQLATFAEDFQKHKPDRKLNNVVVVGDFNLTPWSLYYTELNTAFSGELIDATKRIPFLFTRRLMQFPLFMAHIDHLRTSPSVSVQDLKAIPMPGSDHKAFLFTVKI